MSSRGKLFVAGLMVISLLLAFARPASALTDRQKLGRCYAGVKATYFGVLTAARARQAVARVKYVRALCDSQGMAPTNLTRRALVDLSLGISDYQQYVIGVIFQHPDRVSLRYALQEIAAGKKEALRALG